MRLKLFCTLFLFSMVCRGQRYNLIPCPQVLEPGKGEFIITANTRIVESLAFTQETWKLGQLLQKALGSRQQLEDVIRTRYVEPRAVDISLEYDSTVLN